MSIEAKRYRKYEGNCDECAAMVTYEVHFESPWTEFPPEAEWDTAYLDCAVCGGSIDWVAMS